MLTWALVFLVVSLVAGGLGFTNVAAGAAGIAKILFGLLLAIAVVLVAMALAMEQGAS